MKAIPQGYKVVVKPLPTRKPKSDGHIAAVLKQVRQDAANNPPQPKGKANPIVVAFFWLGTRLQEKPSGYWLDGRPASLNSIMMATNRLLRDAKLEQVASNPAWVVA